MKSPGDIWKTYVSTNDNCPQQPNVPFVPAIKCGDGLCYFIHTVGMPHARWDYIKTN